MEICREELRVIIFYCFRRKLSSTATANEINNTLGFHTVSLRTVQNWFSKFSTESLESFGDKARCGRPSADISDAITTVLENDKRATTREIANQIGSSHQTVWRHLRKAGKQYLQNVWVPHVLNQDQKARRVDCCTRLLHQHQENNFLHQLITVDETWVYWENEGTFNNRTWRASGDAPETVPSRNISSRKHLATIFWDSKGVILMEVLPRNQNMTAEKYCQQLDNLVPAIRDKRRRLLGNGFHNIHFLQDNARPHTAALTKEKLNSIGFLVLEHPPYSPDLAPSDFYLFSPLKRYLSGRTFDNEEEVSYALHSFFDEKDENFFRSGIEKLPNRWQKCIDNAGDYFEHLY